jgi:hypothetical protein
MRKIGQANAVLSPGPKSKSLRLRKQQNNNQEMMVVVVVVV